MSRLHLGIAVGFLLLCCFVYSQDKQTPATRTNSPAAGYELLPAEVTLVSPSGSYEEHRVFLINSASGEAWEYYPERMDKAGKFHGSSFQVVPVASAAR
jgi:hypothetical protein